MRRLLLLLPAVLLSGAVHAQVIVMDYDMFESNRNIRVKLSVQDAKSADPIPFATVYLNRQLRRGNEKRIEEISDKCLMCGKCSVVCQVQVECQEDGQHARVQVETTCEFIRGLIENQGPIVDSWEVCLKTPGTGPFFEYASTHFPPDACCPVLPGIIKCIRAECGLALKKDTYLHFIE